MIQSLIKAVYAYILGWPFVVTRIGFFISLLIITLILFYGLMVFFVKKGKTPSASIQKGAIR